MKKTVLVLMLGLLLIGVNLYAADGDLIIEGDLGIGTYSPAAKLSVVDGAILATGTIGGTPVNGAGTRLMWIPEKGAFRAGTVTGSEWNDANIGSNSVAFGTNNIASGLSSFAIGTNSIASGNFGVAIGNHAKAFGDWGSVAIGDYTRVDGDFAVAMGNQAKASGSWSTAIGLGTRADAEAAIAFGHQVTAGGAPSIAIGKWVTASGNSSIALGSGASNANRLENTQANSLIIGFNSTTPALKVTASTVQTNADLQVNGNLTVSGLPDSAPDGSGSYVLCITNNGNTWIDKVAPYDCQ